MDLPSILKVLNDFGVLGFLVLVLVGGARRWWVWGWAYDATIEERDQWKQLALSGTSLAERAVTLADGHRRSS